MASTRDPTISKKKYLESLEKERQKISTLAYEYSELLQNTKTRIILKQFRTYMFDLEHLDSEIRKCKTGHSVS
jgi:hypothetical protein